jgi:NADH-quinone oxidoreductase subunit E
MQPETKELAAQVDSILARHKRDPGMLVAILQDVQAEHNYLPREALERVSKGLDVPLSQVYSVATFFKALSLKPRGRHLINVCLGTACHVRGAVKVLEAIERELAIESGETTKDLAFTLETVNCVGACALGPVVIVDGEYHGQMNTEKVKGVLKDYS